MSSGDFDTFRGVSCPVLSVGRIATFVVSALMLNFVSAKKVR